MAFGVVFRDASPDSPHSPHSPSDSPPASPAASSTPVSRPKRERRPPPQVYALDSAPGVIRERKRLRPAAAERRRERRRQLAEEAKQEQKEGDDDSDDAASASSSDDSEDTSPVRSPVKRRRRHNRTSAARLPSSQPAQAEDGLLIRLRRRLLKVRGPDGKFKTNIWVYDLLQVVGLDGGKERGGVGRRLGVEEVAKPAVVVPLRARVLNPPPNNSALPAPTVRSQKQAHEEEEKSTTQRPSLDLLPKNGVRVAPHKGQPAGQEEGGAADLPEVQREAAVPVFDDSLTVARLVAENYAKYEDAWSISSEAQEAKDAYASSSSSSSPSFPSFRLKERVQAWHDEEWRDCVVICHAFNSLRFVQSLLKAEAGQIRLMELENTIDGHGEWPITGVRRPLTRWPKQDDMWKGVPRDCYLLYFRPRERLRWFLPVDVDPEVDDQLPHTPPSIPRRIIRRSPRKEQRSQGKEEKSGEPGLLPSKRPPPPAAIDTTRPAFPSLPLSTASSSTYAGLLSPRDPTTLPRQPPTTFPPSPPPPPHHPAPNLTPLPMTSISLLPSIDLQLAQVRSGSHPLILSALAQLQVKTEERRRVAERRRQEGLRLVEEEWKADMKELEEEWRDEWRAVEERVLEEVREERRRGERADMDLGMAAHTRRRRGGLSGLPPGASRPPLRRRFHLEQKLSAGDRKGDLERVKAMIAEQMGEEGKKRLQRIDQHMRGRLTWGGVHEHVRKVGGGDGGPVVETRLRRRE